METQIKSLEAFVKRLQKEAAEFLTNSKIVINGIVIQPTEIEVYYYQEGEFADTTVHRNELQQKNAYHFYIHRHGKLKSDSYKGGNRSGIDYVLSNKENIYYTYLIRSAIINDQLIIGPHKVLVALLGATHLSQTNIESNTIPISTNKVTGDVLFSERIHLGKDAGDFRNLRLRAVLCDDTFIHRKYPAKEHMITDYIKYTNMPKEQAIEFAYTKLGYIPKEIKQL